MIIRCAWCKPKKIIGVKEPLADNSFTDGMCEKCLQKMKESIKTRYLKE